MPEFFFWIFEQFWSALIFWIIVLAPVWWAIDRLWEKYELRKSRKFIERIERNKKNVR